MSRPSSTSVAESTDRRGVQIALWVLRGLLAIVFLQSGLEKFAGAEQSVQTFDEIGLGDWFRYTVGAIEMVGAIGLLVGRAAAAAAVALAVTMVGAVITQVTVVEDGGFVVPLIFGIMAGTIAWVRRRDLLAALALVELGRHHVAAPTDRDRPWLTRRRGPSSGRPWCGAGPARRGST